MAGQAWVSVLSNSALAAGFGSQARTGTPRPAKCAAQPHPITPMPMQATASGPDLGGPRVEAELLNVSPCAVPPTFVRHVSQGTFF